MAEKMLQGRIVNKHDMEENWLKATNFIPKCGEVIIYDVDGQYNYQRMKIGDGITNVNDLPFETPVLSVEDIDKLLNVSVVSAREVKL